MPRSRERLSGVWVAMPTPWRDPCRIDAGVVAELLRRYKAAGFDGAYTTGTDGEMHVLDLPEFRELVDAFSRGIAETGLPAQVGCGWSHTEGVLDRARYAREKGINRIQVAFPSWVTLNDDEILRFYGALQAALPGMEFIHYNIAKSGRFLKGRDYRAILEVAPNLIGSKHTGGDVGALIDVVQATPELDHFVVDGQIVAGALYGAQGFYSFIANLSPEYADPALAHGSSKRLGSGGAAARTQRRLLLSLAGELSGNLGFARARQDRDARRHLRRYAAGGSRAIP